VLTDGTFFWGPNGEEWKRFSFADVMGISLAKKQGIAFALISGEATPLIDRFAEKMGIVDVFKGCKDKAAALREWMTRRGLQGEQVCFMGDDVNDISAMKVAGFAVAPANANEAVIKVVDVVTLRRGGDGAARELLDALLAVRQTPEHTNYSLSPTIKREGVGEGRSGELRNFPAGPSPQPPPPSTDAREQASEQQE